MDKTIFDAIIYSFEVGVVKPDPAIYEIALSRLAIADPREAVFVDDANENVQAALTIGMQAVQFRSSAQIRAEVGELLGC